MNSPYLAPGLGAEIDLRTSGHEIILSHEPFQSGHSFAEFAAAWALGFKRGTLILNPKEDGLENRTLEILTRHGIEDYGRTSNL